MAEKGMGRKMLFGKNIKYWQWIVIIPIILYTGILLYQMISNMIIGLDYPNELREGVNIEFTLALLEGKNPYGKQWIHEQIPGPCYLYPFLYCSVVAAMAKVFPFDIIFLHYSLTFLSMIVSGGIISFLVKEQTKTKIAPVLAFPLALMFHWRYGYVGAVPDSFGFLLFTLAIFFATREGRRNRVPVNGVITVLLFYVKQYYILIAGILILYYLKESKRKAVQYIFFCALCTLLSAFVVTLCFPTYWTYAFYLLKGTEVYFSKKQFLYVLEQFAYIMTIYGIFFILILYRIYKLGREGKLSCQWKIKNLEEPLLSLGIENKEWIQWCHFFVSGFGLFYFGLNDGAYLTYYLQLFAPCLVILGLIAWEEIFLVKAERKKIVFLGVYGMIAMLSLFLSHRRLPFHKLNKEDIEAWTQAYRYLDSYSNEEIYHSPTTAFFAFKNHQYVYDTGHVNITRESNYEIWKDSKTDRFLFPYAGKIYEQHHKHHERMRKKVQEGEYGLITFVQGLDIVLDESLLEERYEKIDTISLYLGNMAYDTQFWALKDNRAGGK